MPPSACSPWTIPAAPSRPCSFTSSCSARDSSTFSATCGGNGGGTLPRRASLSANFVCLIAATTPASSARARSRAASRSSSAERDEPLRVLRAHVVVDPLLDRLGAELGDRVARVDALRAALVAEVAARAVPDPVLFVVARSAARRRRWSRASPTKRNPFASAAGPRNSGSDSIELHSETQQPHMMQSASLWITFICCCETMRSFSRDLVVAGSSHGLIARILLQNGSMSTTRSLTIGRFPIAEITGTWPAVDDRLHPLLAGEHGAAVHAHPARAADHHPAALAVGERAVVLVLDQVEHVEQAAPTPARRPRTRAARARPLRVVAPDLQRDVHPPTVSVRSTTELLGGGGDRDGLAEVVELHRHVRGLPRPRAGRSCTFRI